MVIYSCHTHTTKVMREVLSTSASSLLMVSPAGVGEKCDACGKTAIWAVNIG